MKLKVELEIDLGDNFINENDIEEKVWLFETILTKEELILHSNNIGESIGTITSIKAYEIKTDVEEVKIIHKINN